VKMSSSDLGSGTETTIGRESFIAVAFQK
jgi:hypothetical protein